MAKRWQPLTALQEFFRNTFMDWRPFAVIAVYLVVASGLFHDWKPLVISVLFLILLFALIKDWKAIVIAAVFLTSVFTLFQVEPEQTIDAWRELASLTGQ